MTDEDIINKFTQLFRGRGDAHGNWDGPGSGHGMGALTPDHFQRHLCSPTKTDWIGVYPHLGERGVTWGCIDIDGKDFRVTEDIDMWDWPQMWELADTLQTVLGVKNIWAYLEQTTNGIHVWVFPHTGIAPAASMRRALMAACTAVGYAPKEVNPKQEELAAGKLGNYVRIPYYGHLSDRDGQPDRYMVDADREPVGLEDFLDAVRLTSLSALAEVATLWTPPVRVTFNGPPPEDVAPIISMLSGIAHTIWKDGPLEGRDRSNTLAKLAYTLQQDGIQMPAAFAVVKDADARWGKFADRPDCDDQIMRFVERAYS